MRPPRDIRPKILTEFILPTIGRLIDAVLVSSPVVMAVTLLLAVHAFVNLGALQGLAGLAVSALAAIGVYARFVVPHQLRVRRLVIQKTGLVMDADPPIESGQSLTICFFSDLHVGRFRQAAWVRRIVELVNAQRPDVVLIGGDFVGNLDHHDMAAMLDPLRELRAPYGVFAVFGNHDYGLPGINHTPELRQLLSRLQVRVLHNECVTITHGLRLIGVDELWAGLDDVERAFTACEECGQSIRQPCPVIFLGHNPDLMLKIRRCAALFLFGHTHAGQLYVPLLPGMGVPILSNLYRGLHDLPQGKVYVSSGCGESSTPARLGTWPEIVLVSLEQE